MSKLNFCSISFLCFLGLMSCNNTSEKESLSETKKQETIIDSVPETISSKYTAQFSEVDFPSLDSLMIKGHWYSANDAASATTILLCHQAGWNKYEYDSIAVALQAKGYNCLAIDQRSGGKMGKAENAPKNETTLRATAAKKPIDYLDAEQDISAAINYAYNKYQKPIILCGSSYSSTLALYLGLNNDSVAAVVSFSPGDYFKKEKKSSLIDVLKDSEKPFWITSSLEEAPELEKLVAGKALNKNQIRFVPKGKGYHGARALWATNEGNEAYWSSLLLFLEKLP